nr:RHS repeat-associated core domain-containing protein [Rothia terrae]
MVVNGQATDYTYDQHTGLLTTLMRTHSADNAVGEKGQSQSVPSVLESLTYHYDQDAHLTHITDHTGAVLRAFNTVPTIVEAGTTGGAQEADASYVTDGGWATIEHRHVDGQQQSVTTYYNAEGLVIGVDDTADGLRLLTYDDAHQLTAVMTDHGTHRFTYDTAGFLIGEETTTGVTREYTYDDAGQLVRLQDSQVGVSEYVYDGLGRRVQHTDHTGAVSTYAYSPVGLLAEIIGEERDAVYLWNDALGQVAAVATGSVGTNAGSPTMMCTLTWDPVAFTPTVLGVNNTLVSLGALASLDAVGGRGVDPFGLSPVVAGFTTGSGVGSDVSSDAQGLLTTGSIPGVPGLGLTRAGSVQVAGLEILGVRAYDATTRGFMSPDPLVSPVGAGWAGNVYAFAGNDPVGQVDPWGLSPMTAAEFREYRQDTSARAIERMGKGLADFADRNAGWIALGVAAVGVAALAVSGPIGWGILTGMALSGGIEIGSQLLSGEPLDWKKIAKSASIGGIAGGVGAGVAGLATKVGSKIFTSIASKYSTQAGAVNQQMSQVFRNVATNPTTKNAVPKIVTGLKRTQQSLMGNAQRYSSLASKVGSAGAREGVAAYVEAGTDTTLTYITDGHHVTGKGLVAAWGVPAVSNAVLPKPVSKYVDNRLTQFGWEATGGVSQKIRSEVAQGVGNFTNGVVSYSGAPMTYSPQYESFRDSTYDGVGWDFNKAWQEGLKETFKGGASSSHPVESLKSVSFEAKPVSSGVDYAGMARDSAMLSAGASGVEVSAASIYHHEKGTTNE